MSWAALLELIADELGREAAARVQERARVELAGVRLTISQRIHITPEMIDAVAPGRPKDAARELGVHPVTVYRALKRPRLIR